MLRHVKRVMDLNHYYATLLLDDIPDGQMCQQPGSMVNHPAWSLGHITLSLEQGAMAIGMPSSLPEKWRTLFGLGSKPTPNRADYPGKAELVRAYDAQHQRISARLETLSAEELQEPNEGEGARGLLPTVGDALLFVATAHAGVHLGQISAWRRLMGLPHVLPMDRELDGAG